MLIILGGLLRLTRSFRYAEELDLNMNSYMVSLEKPVGLSFAPDPNTGEVPLSQLHMSPHGGSGGACMQTNTHMNCLRTF